jgi:hypothetical protein
LKATRRTTLRNNNFALSWTSQRRPIRVLPLVLLVVAVALSGVFLESPAHANGTESSTAAVRDANSQVKLRWIIDAHAITLLRGVGASQKLLDEAFNNDRTYVSGSTSGIAADDVPDAVRTVTYESYQSIKTAFADKKLPGDYRALLYDNEHWKFTPPAEQDNPAHYEELVAQLAHKHGMIFIATPAVDLVYATGKLVKNSAYDTYLSRDIAGEAAKYADVLDIQAQGSEANLHLFTSFADAAIKQAKKANPRIILVVGISTNAVTRQQLYSAYLSMVGKADGYWLNIPGKSSYCPGCGAPKPGTAYYLLQKIYGNM